MLQFPCEQCGACCQEISGIQELIEFDLGNGRCSMLQLNNLCAIYSSRPGVCRHDYVYEHFFSYLEYPVFVERMKAICLLLQSKYGERVNYERL